MNNWSSGCYLTFGKEISVLIFLIDIPSAGNAEFTNIAILMDLDFAYWYFFMATILITEILMISLRLFSFLMDTELNGNGSDIN